MNSSAEMSVSSAQDSLLNDYDFLPMILDILSSVEKCKDSKEDLSKKVNAFKTKLANCTETLQRMPGLDSSPDEQELVYRKCVKDLAVKKQALEKFRNLDVILATDVKQDPG